jgi:hypothetical protein
MNLLMLLHVVKVLLKPPEAHPKRQAKLRGWRNSSDPHSSS